MVKSNYFTGTYLLITVVHLSECVGW